MGFEEWPGIECSLSFFKLKKQVFILKQNPGESGTIPSFSKFVLFENVKMRIAPLNKGFWIFFVLFNLVFESI